MIRRVLTPLVLVLVTAASVQARQLDYESMGTVAVKIDGMAHELCIPYLTDEDEAYAVLISPLPSIPPQSLLIDAFTCADGNLGSPSLSLSIFRPSRSAMGSDFELRTADGTTYIVGEGDGMGMFEFGTLKVMDMQMSDDSATLAFEATAVAVELEGLDYQPIEGLKPVEVSGSVEVEFRQ